DFFSVLSDTPVRHVNPKGIRPLWAAVLAGASRAKLEKQERADALPNAPWSFAENLREQKVLHVLSRTAEVSDRRRQGRWSARSTLELPPGIERRSGAAV